jgi:MYND finger
LREYYEGKDSMKESTQRTRESSEHFRELVDSFGPKSNMKTWDRLVYAECMDRLAEPFYWKDVHWDVDKPELLRRADLWNSMLLQYCDDAGLVGEGREWVVKVHRANPCAPCGCVGCNEVEEKVREFQRCGQCKRIAYCSRACQKKDWAAHKQACKAASASGIEPTGGSGP